MIVFAEFMRGVKCSAIEWLARFGRDPFTLLIVVIAGLGTVHILVRTATYGLAVQGHSLRLLSTAINFLMGEGWRDLWGDPMTTWPPLFPLLAAAGGWVGIEPLAAGRLINATAFGLTILAAGCWLRSNLRARWLAVVATGAIAASLPLSEFASLFLTDFLFAVLTLLALMQLASFLHRGGRRPLLWGAVFTALAALTRYPGVVLIGTGVLMLLVRRTPPLAVRLKDSIVFGAVSSLPLAVVLMRNWAISGHWTGREGQSGQSLSDGLSQTVDVFRAWVTPNALGGLGALLWLAAGLLVAVGVGVVVVVSGRGLGSGGNTGTARLASPLFGLGPALPFGVFALAYPVFLVAVVPFTVEQIIDSRYLLPVYVPVLLVAVMLLDRFLSIKVAGGLVAVRYGLASLVGLGALAHVGFSARENLRYTAHAYVHGYKGYNYGSYNTARWQQLETLNYIQDNHIEGRIYSNRGDPAWFWDRTAALGKSRKYRRIGHEMKWTEIEAGAHIVLFEQFYNRVQRGYDDLDLRLLPGMEIVAELADGMVLRRTAVEPFDAARHRVQKQRYVDQLIQQASERVVRAGWTVYHTGRKLIYHKEPCAPAEVQAKFILQVTPVTPAALIAHRKRHGFDSLGFYFDRRGFYLGDQCIAVARLPAYAIDRIRVGQWNSKDNRTLWEAEFAPGQ